ncbi:hypothetical protein E2C01_011319 [Portunus trituberculatus]|uniref:Uncharacterized protein n=1 Tax=Portunus trituberculatus TaxID=210409 RepID=A0A5B7DAS6_PORTR|nr:hypothetical protein [Portunus trituberculatus]
MASKRPSQESDSKKSRKTVTTEKKLKVLDHYTKTEDIIATPSTLGTWSQFTKIVHPYTLVPGTISKHVLIMVGQVKAIHKLSVLLHHKKTR